MSSGDILLGPTCPPRSTMIVKRAFDVAASAAGLLVLLPLFIAVAVSIKFDSPGPIFFRQERVGWRGRPFRIFKFRTMVAEAEKAGPALTVRDDKRITAIGIFLRSSKLDELPQLLNVLSGDMSIVGPRPEVPDFMQFYTPQQCALVVSMRPGLTDYAALCFHDESSMLDGESDPIETYRNKIMPIKFALYERYSREIGALTDLRLILATCFLLITGRIPTIGGITHELHHTALAATKQPPLHPEQPAGLTTDDIDAVRANRLGIVI
jgi:lipopolysaccharide/colanic/teichoic acid biosynthesis glycosyltransferase